MNEKEVLREIDRYLNGKLTEQEVDRLWEQFLQHPEWMQLLETEAAAREYFRKHPGGDDSDVTEMSAFPLPRFSGRPVSWLYGVALILVMMIAGHFFPAETSRLDGLLTAIPPEEMVTMEVFRSTKDTWSPVDIEINRGFESAASGRTEESMRIYEKVLEGDHFPAQSSVAHLNYGILLYNQGRYQEALSHLTRIEPEASSVYVREKREWFRAQALVQLQQWEAAHQTVEETIAFDGLYRKDAERLLKSMKE